MRPFPGRGRFMQVPALFEFGHVRALSFQPLQQSESALPLGPELHGLGARAGDSGAASDRPCVGGRDDRDGDGQQRRRHRFGARGAAVRRPAANP